MARYHLKKSLQQMYGGELVVIGSPYIRPYDFLYVFDVPNAMHGTCEVGRVIHSFDIQNGFTTAISIEPIVAVDDAFQFGWTTTAWNMQEEEAIRKYATQNMMAGYATQGQVDASIQETNAKETHRKTLGVLDMLTEKTISGGTHAVCTQLLQNSMFLSRENDGTDPLTQEETEAYRKQTEAHNEIWMQKAAFNPNVISAARDASNAQNASELSQSEIASLTGGAMGNSSSIEGQPERTNFENKSSASDVVEAFIAAISFGSDVVPISGMADPLKLYGIQAGIAAAFAIAGGPGTLPLTASPIGTLAAIWGLFKIREWAIEFAEAEPIQIILMNKDGKPMEAGLKGADGIIVGNKLSLGWLSDYMSIDLPTRMDETVYNKLGISLSESLSFRKAKSYSERITANKIIENNGSAEAFNINNFPPLIVEVTVKEIIDGDTIWITGPVTDTSNGTIYEFTPDHSIRLWGINAPETLKNIYGEAPAMAGGNECANALSSYINNSIANGKVKLVINRMNAVDAYGRGLAIVMAKGISPHYDTIEAWVESGNCNLSDLFNESLQMKLQMDFYDKGWIQNLYVVGESTTQDYITELMNDVSEWDSGRYNSNSPLGGR
jgi:endonuclease YncB( thermonuclease family)